jgi:hypothetical protein
MDQLSFLRAVVDAMARDVKQKEFFPGYQGKVLPQSAMHMQIRAEKEGRCKMCKKPCKNKCGSCNVHLHRDCALQYHEQ